MKKLLVLTMIICFIIVFINCGSSTEPEKLEKIIGDGGIYNLAEEKLGEFANKQQFLDLLINRYLNDDLKKLINESDDISNKTITLILLDTRKGSDNQDDLRDNILSMCNNEKFILTFYEERKDEQLIFHRKKEDFENSKTIKRLKEKHIQRSKDKSDNGQILAINIYIPLKEIVSIQICKNKYIGKYKWSWEWQPFYINNEFEGIYKICDSSKQLNNIWPIYLKKNKAIRLFLNEYLAILKTIESYISEMKNIKNIISFHKKEYNSAKKITDKLVKLKKQFPKTEMEFSNLYNLDKIPQKYFEKTKRKINEIQHQIKLLFNKKSKELYNNEKKTETSRARAERKKIIEDISKKIELLFLKTKNILEQETIKHNKLEKERIKLELKRIEEEKIKQEKLEKERVKSCSTPEFLGKYIVIVTDGYIKSLKKVTSKEELFSTMKEYASELKYIKEKGEVLLKKNLNLKNDLKNSVISKKVKETIQDMDYAYLSLGKNARKHMTDLEVQKITLEMNKAENIINLFSIKEIHDELPNGLYAKIKTYKGEITLSLTYKKTPLTVMNFVGLIEGKIENSVKKLGEPFYDGLKFHKVGSMIHAGNPYDDDPSSGPGYFFPDEFHPDLKHDRSGILTMCRREPDKNGSQFFITKKALPYLNNRATVFGKVVNGYSYNSIKHNDVIRSIKIIRIGKEAENFVVSNQAFKKLLTAAPEMKKLKAAERKRKIEKTIEMQKKIIAERWPNAQTTKNGLRYIITKEGKGNPPKVGDWVVVHYNLFLLNGKKINKTYDIYDNVSAFKFIVGGTISIKFFNKIIISMKQGEKRTIIIPYSLAYRSISRSLLPPYSALHVDMELIDIKKR